MTEVPVLEIADVVSPQGRIRLAVIQGRLCGLGFADRWDRIEAHLRARFGRVRRRRVEDPAGVAGRLRAYLGGDLGALEAIPVDTGGTPFRQRVWRALRSVPPGGTVSYGELARLAGAPEAVRAVGTTCGANPVGIVIPCHRVIRADGGLGGYGGGLDRKRWLLEHEHLACSLVIGVRAG